ncbi:MAG: UDP-N-acetylmuramate dehydrogenase [Candidatus Magasanikbacteria bacterium]|nr:UDP-N-acetylmuramate dehydrogenase [Candidatus Magasanikbacteria bacterium]
MNNVYQQLKQFGKVKINERMSKHTTFEIGGPARFFVVVEETEKLVGLLNFLNAEGIGYFILGNGSNFLLPDGGFDGVVVKIRNQKLEIRNNEIEAEAGVSLGEVLALALKNNLAGMEWAIGIPGTVGGAICGNAGAFGSDVSANVDRVEVWRDGEVVVLSKGECGFVYRGSGLKKDGSVVLRAWFQLMLGDKQEIMNKTQKNLQARQGRFPAFPSPGCFFKNVKLEKWPGKKEDLPPLFLERGTVPVGWLVEQVDAKGETVGGAMVSKDHGNFIVNVNNATQSDVLKLVEQIKEKVYNKFGVELEEEVEVVK